MTDVDAGVRPLTGPTGRLVTAHRTELREVLRRHSVTNPMLFGSVARGDDHPGSDVDILVDFPPGTGLFSIAQMQAELEEVVGVDVDLVPAAGLKPVVRARVEPDLIAL
ncbi:MAG: nucleotidyltransferase family protein [Micrococcales bacterium]|nr:nucleotidyltransferase family protein [Micrococcales bacterium]